MNPCDVGGQDPGYHQGGQGHGGQGQVGQGGRGRETGGQEGKEGQDRFSPLLQKFLELPKGYFFQKSLNFI